MSVTIIPTTDSPAAAPRDRLAPQLRWIVGFALLLIALYFTLCLNASNWGLWRTFRALSQPFQWGGEPMPWVAILWSSGAVVVFTVLGWFFLETLELYLPRGAAAALSFLVGLGLAGFLFELLAIPGFLIRPLVMIFPGLLLLALWPFAAWAARRPPETGEGGEGGAIQQRVRRQLAREHFERTLIHPASIPQRVYRDVAFFAIGVITLLTFYHALLYPETYWDSLILYLGYARMMFEKKGIVEKVVGQVGIGLGANYPHMYSLLGAAISLAEGFWSEIPQRLIAPCAGFASTVLVYHTVLRMTRHVNFSLSIALLYRATPIGIIYNQYASDYALTILFAAGFLYVALLYIETGLRGYFILATVLIALAMHLNYLMGILWLPWGFMILGAHLMLPSQESLARAEQMRERRVLEGRVSGLERWDAGESRDAPWTFHRDRPGLFRFLWSGTPWVTLTLCVAVASTWYVRNWIVTGNPVYAFFFNIFGGKNINPAVMTSAEIEWKANGAGIAQFGDDFATRLRHSWEFFVTWRQAWQLGPLFCGFFIPGAIIWLARAIAALFSYGGSGGFRFQDYSLRFGPVVLSLIAALLGYHYFLAAFYLYQIVMFLPALAIVAAYSFPYWHAKGLSACWAVLLLWIALVPGVAMGMMGFKVFSPVAIGPGRFESPVEDLFVFRHPMTDPERFYSWRYGRDPEMWAFINTKLKGKKILTHENRHLVFDPSIELVHLDDWVMQREVWPLPPEKKIEALKVLGVHYYLKVPNEDRHPINSQFGTAGWLAQGLVTVEFQAGDNILYKIK